MIPWKLQVHYKEYLSSGFLSLQVCTQAFLNARSFRFHHQRCGLNTLIRDMACCAECNRWVRPAASSRRT